MSAKNNEVITEEKSATEEQKPPARPLPAPGRSLSYEEAKKLTFKKYDEALRELAK